MSKFGLDREVLAQITNNHKALVALERVFRDVGGTLPSAIEQVSAVAAHAIATANSALVLLAELGAMVDQLAAAPAPQEASAADDHTPRVQLGTISAQDHDAVNITGGAIDGTEIGQIAAARGSFTTLSATDQITSTLPDGLPPLVVISTALVENLYAARAALADEANHALTANYADSAGTADVLSAPTTYPADASDLPTVIALANALKAAALSKGL